MCCEFGTGVSVYLEDGMRKCGRTVWEICLETCTISFGAEMTQFTFKRQQSMRTTIILISSGKCDEYLEKPSTNGL